MIKEFQQLADDTEDIPQARNIHVSALNHIRLVKNNKIDKASAARTIKNLRRKFEQMIKDIDISKEM